MIIKAFLGIILTAVSVVFALSYQWSKSINSAALSVLFFIPVMFLFLDIVVETENRK